jgi:succinoglycan biosynthesis protein ExoV
MKLFYYRGEKPNFGDDLNAWMWPRLMPDVWDDNEDVIFLGIGSILFNDFPKTSRKIVFGAGYGGYTPLPQIDESWKFYFVRGKYTAKSMNIDPALGIGDAAILLRSCIGPRPPKRHKVSFMPHWESTLFGNWSEACKLAGIHYIDPTATVEQTLDDILSSELVITEAMHGAIVSDALRVPWIAVTPLQTQHHMKWQDWASALDLTINSHPLGASTLLESALQFSEGNANLTGKLRRRGNFLRHVLPSVFADRVAGQLTRLAKMPATLSRDASIESSHQRMLENMDLLLADMKR